jgi:segregation and condensation protein A
MSFVLELDNFQGPFDLLLALLDKQELEITDISLSKITDDYLDYIENMDLSIEEMNSFLFVAAKLTLDKSRAIISEPSLEEDIDLTESLIQYQAIKNQAKVLLRLSKKPMKSRSQNIYLQTKIENIEPKKLQIVFLDLLRNYKNKEVPKAIKNNRDHLAKSKIKFINQIKKLRSFSIDEMMSSASSKAEAIVFFMSILDLIKNEKIQKRGSTMELVG